MCRRHVLGGATRHTIHPGDARGTPLVGGWVGLEALGILTRMGRDLGSVVLPEYLSGLQNFSPTRRSAKSENAVGSRRFFRCKQSPERIAEETASRAPKGNAQPLRRMGMQGAKPLLSKCLNYRNRTLYELMFVAYISAWIVRVHSIHDSL